MARPREDAPEPVVAVAGSSYAEAIRRRDFQAAAQLIDRTPAEERARPEVRLARARSALALEDVSTALEQVTGLEEDFPDFGPHAREVVLGCARLALDVTVLEHLLGSEARAGHSEDRMALLAAYEAGGQEQQALTGLGQVIDSLRQLPRRSRAEDDRLARATKRRAVLLEHLGQPQMAANDYRWLALDAPTHLEAVSADQHFERLSGTRLLSGQRLTRAKALSERGQVTAVEEELRRLASAPGPAVPAGEPKVTLAWAVYASRTDYPLAAKLFAEGAALDPKEQAHHLYYSAKSLARAHDHRAAIATYQRVVSLPGTYADHATYNIARLHYIDGEFGRAIAQYQKYAQRYPSGAHRQEATYELAIARLAAAEHSAARRDLQLLVRTARNDREQARLIELEALAAQGQGDPATARALYHKAIADRPLSFSALLASARLSQAKASVPPPLLPPPVGDAPRGVPLSPQLPDVVRRLDRVGLDDDAEQALRAREKEIRARFGERGLEALCQLYGQLALAERRYQVAQTAVSASALSHAPAPGNRWQWECIYPTPHQAAIQRESTAREVPAALVYAIIRQESAFRPRVVSPAQAVGLMQIIPSTARQIASELGEEYDSTKMVVPAVNVRYGVYYLRRLLDMFGQRPELAAAAYNAGPHAVESWLRGGDDLPLDVFVAKIPYEETRNYVYRVMANYARYQYLLEGTTPSVSLELPRGLKASDGAY